MRRTHDPLVADVTASEGKNIECNHPFDEDHSWLLCILVDPSSHVATFNFKAVILLYSLQLLRLSPTVRSRHCWCAFPAALLPRMVDSEQIEEPWPRNWMKYPALGNGGLVMTSRHRNWVYDYILCCCMMLYVVIIYIYVYCMLLKLNHICILLYTHTDLRICIYIYIYIYICVYACACVRYVFVMSTRNGPMRFLPPWARRPRGPSPRWSVANLITETQRDVHLRNIKNLLKYPILSHIIPH